MIYSTNRTASLGTVAVDADSRYFGEGAFTFGQECAQDELAIFEMAIKSDIDEAILTNEGYVSESAELVALNEGFVHNAMKKVKEMMQKLKAWIQAVMRSAFAKLSSLVVRDNAKFAKIARKQITKMQNSDKFKYDGKYVDFKKLDQSIETYKSRITNYKIMKSGEVKDDTIKAIETAINNSPYTSKEELIIKNDGQLTYSDALNQLNYLEKYSKKHLKELKRFFEDAIRTADGIYKSAGDYEKKLGDDATEEQKTDASNFTRYVSLYKSLLQKDLKECMSLINAACKAARSVVTKAMGATPKNESFISPELIDAMNESVLLEYDEALEDMSEGADCEDTDEDILDDDED